MTGAEVVESHARSVREVASLLAAQFGQGDLLTALHDLLRGARAGTLPEKGRIERGLGYSIHGRGARFELDDGRIIDLDLDTRGGAGVVWDAWRLRDYARSIGAELTLPDADQSLAEAAGRGALRSVGTGWFTLPAGELGGSR